MVAMHEGGGYSVQVPYLTGKQPTPFYSYSPPAPAVHPPYLPGKEPAPFYRAPRKSAPKKSSGGNTHAKRQALSNYSHSRSYGNSGGGGGQSRSYSSGVGSNSTGQVSPVSAPSTDSFLAGDSAYQDQIAQYNKALSDYQAQNNAEINQYNVGYGRNKNDLGIQQTRDDDALQNDFASRGMYVSGLQAQDRGKLLDDYARRFSDLDTGRSDFLADQSRNLGNYKNDVNLNINKAKQDALNRRALQYNL